MRDLLLLVHSFVGRLALQGKPGFASPDKGNCEAVPRPPLRLGAATGAQQTARSAGLHGSSACQGLHAFRRLGLVLRLLLLLLALRNLAPLLENCLSVGRRNARPWHAKKIRRGPGLIERSSSCVAILPNSST